MKTIIRNAAAVYTPVLETDSPGASSSILAYEQKDIVIEGSKIEDIRGASPSHFNSGDYRIIDAAGAVITPGFVDSHTHILYCGKRTEEFYMRLSGSSYSEVLQKGGGILSTVRATRNCSADDLYRSSISRIRSAVRTGTTTMEIKTGYGLNLSTEQKMIESILRIRETGLLRVVSTALPLHAVPEGYGEEDYVNEVLDSILPEIMRHSDFVDIFCDKGAFSVASAERLAIFLEKNGKDFRMHAGEIENIGCAQLAGKYRVRSMDHLLHTSERDLDAMKLGGTIATFLPVTAFSLGEAIPDVNSFRAHGIPISIATDSSPLTMCQNMLYAMHLAVRFYHMTPAETFLASTINPARSLSLQDQTGTISKGKNADLLFLSIDDIDDLPYMWSTDPVSKVMYNGGITFEDSKVR